MDLSPGEKNRLLVETAIPESEIVILAAEPEAVCVAAIADTHGLSFACPPADVLIHAGDMTAWGEWSETAALGRALGEEDYRAVLLVPGNHDRIFEKLPRGEAYPFSPNTHLLIDEAWEYRGRLFYGSPWTPFFDQMNPAWTAFMAAEEELRRRFDQMPAEIDVLITHGPPWGILDNGAGSLALREAVEKRIVRHHVFGHCHELGGRSRSNVQSNRSLRTSYNVAAIVGNGTVRSPRLFQI